MLYAQGCISETHCSVYIPIQLEELNQAAPILQYLQHYYRGCKGKCEDQNPKIEPTVARTRVQKTASVGTSKSGNYGSDDLNVPYATTF